jgi:hypothetical protein
VSCQQQQTSSIKHQPTSARNFNFNSTTAMEAADHPANLEPPGPSISTTTGRIKGKPGAGLRRMPQSAQEWFESAAVHGLAARTLADLCRRGIQPCPFLPSPSFSPLSFFVISWSNVGL